MPTDKILKRFVEAQNLPNRYIAIANRWFLPLIEKIRLHHKRANAGILVGINGAQGSGKSTLCHLMTELLDDAGLNSVAMSLDDFYLTKDERHQLAGRIHPLLATRGVPGTHDVALLESTIYKLRKGEATRIPRFNKALDDRACASDSQFVEKPVDVIILEGWCVGAQAQMDNALEQPINKLEEINDTHGIWRRYVNECLGNEYQEIFDGIEYMVMLKAPSFDSVYRWRCEQEHKMFAKQKADKQPIQGMNDAQIATFIQHYQRITEHSLQSLPQRCDCVFILDEEREIQSCL